MQLSSCLIGITFLISSIYLSIMRKDSDIFIKFMNLLNDEQKKIYSRIIIERTGIYIIGMIIGLSVALYYVLTNKKDNYKICKFLFIVYTIKLGFYYFYPKSPLMLYSLTTKEQVDTWADIYTEMKDRWKKSLMVGLIGYLILSSMI